MVRGQTHREMVSARGILVVGSAKDTGELRCSVSDEENAPKTDGHFQTFDWPIDKDIGHFWGLHRHIDTPGGLCGD